MSDRGYYSDGLTPPTRNVIRRRFLKARPDHGKFDPAEVSGGWSAATVPPLRWAEAHPTHVLVLRFV